MNQSNIFVNDVITEFCNDISGRLNIDLGWAVKERAENIAKATDQYVEGLADVNYRKDGERNNNPNRFGNQFEERDVALRNIDEAIKGSGKQFTTTDKLYNDKMNGQKMSKSKSDAATYNDDSTDVIAHQRGRVLKGENRQHKVIQNSADLAVDRYLENNQYLTVPQEDIEKHRSYWEKQKAQGDAKAESVLQKLEVAVSSKSAVTLEGGLVEACINATTADSAEAKKKLRRLADHKLELEAKTMQVASHASVSAVNVAKNASGKFVSYLAGRVIQEIYEAWNSNDQKSITESLSSIFNDAKARFKEEFKTSGLTEIRSKASEFFKNIIFSFFKDLRGAFKKGGKYLSILVKEVWSFIKGETRSFSSVIINISKALVGLAVIGVCSTFNTYLKSLGLPDYICIVLTAFVSAVLTVTLLKLIDQTAKVVISILAAAEAAKLKRQEIEAICEQAFPLIDQQTIEYENLVLKEIEERQETFNSSFADIQNSVDSESISVISSAYSGLYQYFNIELPFTNEEEFDAFMLGDEDFVL
ncbi:hypothetical protein MD588_08740 [Photobacterium sp. SDRW27]|uniref:hypothetical protein n=1 Tax=Photobacterium obscurum TaxID=2829490 RepID=UPI0022443F45|nr:hypothetical protein [Photobacterium obscurum]MCW8328894.1 hypothetical protein [Photobacterium obscurum]